MKQRQSTAFIAQPEKRSSLKKAGVLALSAIGLVLIASLVTGIGVYLFSIKISQSTNVAQETQPPNSEQTPIASKQSPIAFPAKEILRFGSRGTSEGQFSNPPIVGLGNGDQKILYAADQFNGRIYIFDWNGTLKKQFQLESKEEIRGLEFSTHFVYVLQGGKILQFSAKISGEFELKGEIGKKSAGVPVFDTTGKLIGKSTSASAYSRICVGKNGLLYAIDEQNYIVRFAEDQRVKDKIQIDSSSDEPGIDLAVDESGVIYALIGDEITKIAQNGKRLLFACLECNSMPIQEIEVDESGLLYMISNKRFMERRGASFSSIAVVNTHGKYLGEFGLESGSLIGGFSTVRDTQNTQVFISRSVGDKIQIVRYEIQN